ncbi:hypothetical protein A2Z33_00765 [Candidatus Gottesmanbacteria bacterium RBG_16_52_11]|uniref:Excinuclease ABC subunit C n=1 Tax=Candidatus Gottesmanbacteria bacterium RBG_16_52_11 TaxID=1798374 RepID=A0A1F5YNX1_9BACT|nr:MAG: hypothetical protein A2Z33_00765 [Candidatus Gottesmanbacteria bacterium RBG_16_52_11]
MEIIRKEIQLKTRIRRMPHTPGVYMFRDVHGAVLYVGKAADLRNRVSQYTAGDAIGSKTGQMVSQAESVEILPTVSEFDALILEAKQILRYQPKYNIISKDDKSPLFVRLEFSRELPVLRFLRKGEALHRMNKNDAVFGPFQSGRAVRSLLRSIRHIIPYCTQKIRNGRPCFYSQIGLCRPCPSLISVMPDGILRQDSVRIYRRNFRRIRDLLDGRSGSVIRSMETEMRRASKAQDFEKAAELRDKTENLRAMLRKHYDPAVYTETTGLPAVAGAEGNELSRILRRYIPVPEYPKRIECIDISNISGDFATGSLVVFTDGLPDKSWYRRFRIRKDKSPDDFASVAEITRRRFNHPDWPAPDLFVVDGGKGQLSAVNQVLRQIGINLPAIGLAKHEEEIIIQTEDGFHTLKLNLSDPGLHLLQRIRDEAHRFAHKYHTLLRKAGRQSPV